MWVGVGVGARVWGIGCEGEFVCECVSRGGCGCGCECGCGCGCGCGGK